MALLPTPPLPSTTLVILFEASRFVPDAPGLVRVVLAPHGAFVEIGNADSLGCRRWDPWPHDHHDAVINYAIAAALVAFMNGESGESSWPAPRAVLVTTLDLSVKEDRT